MIAVVDRLGQKVFENFNYSWKLFLMTYLSFRSALVGRNQGWRTLYGVVSAQIYFTGWQAMPLIVFLAAGTGAIISLQAVMQMTFLGGVDAIGQFMVMIVLREVGPLLTALIVVARSGTAVASELGSMQVNKEMDALRTMGINPLSYVIFPRIVGGVISVLCLAFYFVLFAALAGATVCRVIKGMPFDVYFTSISQAADFGDVFVFFLKNMIGGLIIFSVCCHQGMQVERSPHEIPQVTTKAVVNSTVYILGFYMFLTCYYYLEYVTSIGLPL